MPLAKAAETTLAKPSAKAKRPAKPTRSEKNDDVKRRLFSAAAKVVGRHGYAEASVARITDLAGVAQGTFYNHFGNRQELLDQLLPATGQQMVAYIQQKMDQSASELEKEQTRFRAFFEFLQETPEFLRILNEAEFYAPEGYQKHLDNIAAAYIRILKRGRGDAGVGDYTDEELEVIVHILMGARGYLSRRYAYGETGARPIPDHVETAYMKLIEQGLIRCT
jgi:AcrR family transcriptional regulator